MIVGLYLIEEDKCIFLLLHLIPGNGTQSQIEVIYRLGFRKDPVTDLVCFHIHLNIVGKKFLAYFPYYIGLPYLACAIHDKDLVRP